MSAGTALQAALVAALDSVPDIQGIFDGPPARAAFPYVTIDAGSESDWSHKSGEGREIAVAVTVWDDQPARLNQIADAVEYSMRATGPVAGWRLAGLRFVRRRVVRDVAGPWAAALDFRARLLAD